METEQGTTKYESIKLTKNTRGYGWEIRILPPNNETLDVKQIDRIKALDDEMKKRFDTGESSDDE